MCPTPIWGVALDITDEVAQAHRSAQVQELLQYLALGWNPQPLGLPAMLWGASLIPIMVDVSEAALEVTGRPKPKGSYEHAGR